MEISPIYYRRTGRIDLWRTIFCRRCQRYCPFIRCQRFYHRTYTGGRRYLFAGTGNFRHGSLEKNPGIAIGNVIGSNLFNVFFVLGCSASLSPLPMGNINNIDMAVLVGSSILFWLVGWFFKKRTITRIEGGLLVACYIAYTAFLISQQ